MHAAEADRLDARSSETAQRMASVATTPPPPTEEDLEQLAGIRHVRRFWRYARENALKFLAKRDFDPEQAAQAYTAMRDATPEQLGEGALVEEEGSDTPPAKQIRRRHPSRRGRRKYNRAPRRARRHRDARRRTVIHCRWRPRLPPFFSLAARAVGVGYLRVFRDLAVRL